MKDKFNKLTDYLKSIQPRKLLALLTLVIIMAAIPLTVFVSQQQQKTKQQAAEPLSSDLPQDYSPPKQKINIPDDKAVESLDSLSNRRPLSQDNLNVRKNLIQKLMTSSSQLQSDVEGTIFSNENVSIGYVGALDDFEIQILTTNIDLAKTQAEEWLQQQGLTKQAICDLPLFYYLSPDVADALPQDTTFDPNPLACQ
jgi:hypothetical protein